ncbi:hypothetical protein CYY_000760 [Polysphondylium violaceum]|uniref:Carbohydrate binding domain-containing protein n=1 Tax=Polysphondylium violaceum TaxID=133409 RepID=A0A8J4Q296_9MYCE|nr:hypothetical protein CYY_000760 [Polysphondylium violaceum]
MSTNNKLFVLLFLNLSCLFISTCTAQDPSPYSFGLSGCTYSTTIPASYMGDYSEFVFTTNNGTVTLPKSVSKWSIMTSSTLYATLTLEYEPPVIFHYNGKTYDITEPFTGCIYNTSSLTQAASQVVSVNLLSNPLNGQSFDIYVDDVKIGTQTIPATNMNRFNLFSVNVPYTQYTHSIKLVSNNQSFATQLSYVGPEITTYECIRGFKQIAPYGGPEVVNYCKFVGNKLHSFGLISGVATEDAQVSLTSINATLLGNLPLGALITLDSQAGINYYAPDKTTTYFQPHPLPSDSTFTYGKDPNDYITATIQGTYLDAVLLNQTKLNHGGQTSMINCQYSFVTSLANGYQESITCTIPDISDYSAATISLTPTYYPNAPLVLTADNSQPSSSYFIQPSMFFLVTLLLVSLLFFNNLF